MKKNTEILSLLLLFTCLFWVSQGKTQHIPSEQQTQWKHFKKFQFTLDGAEAWYIEPAKPLTGKPWVWRAYFPDWHIEMDSILLERGIAIAYIKANDLFGHASAMNLWDALYDYLTGTKQFAAKPALEAVSRGGLYAYAWAKRNPSKVSCIYAEAPVCDFTSWPGGKGRGSGSTADWEKLLNVYGFSDTEAIQYKDQPKDNLETLAAYRVPILHVIGLNDSVVPNEENTFALVQNYIKAGGPATIVPMTKGAQSLQGHHFPIEKPEALANFIISNTVPAQAILPAEQFISFNEGLNNLAYRIHQKDSITVAFLGGSITNMTGWRNIVCRFLTEHYPQARFRFINAGIPSLGSLPHAFRLQNDVLSKGRVDLLFAESAVNDFVNGTPPIAQRRSLEGIIRNALTHNPYMNIVLMGFADEFKIADYRAQQTPAEIQLHQDLANHYRIPFINLASEVYQRIHNKELSWQDDFKDLHPSPYGQALYANSIQTLLKRALQGSPNQLAKAKMPAPLDSKSYNQGNYLPVSVPTKRNGFTINNSWEPADCVNTRPGFVQVPVLEATDVGASLELTFKGTAIGIAILSGPDAGAIEYTIDGKETKTADLYTQWSKSLHLPWYILLGDGLSKGSHRLRLKVVAASNTASKGNAVRIVHFLVNQ
ncbi:GDSL-type esterase/lipase family protein [Niabella sp. CJ426]|uniref:SGNH/GDSL hydrolase family protein n=1 Tax=Niabella sp. CJ426 TaxID=3393740 RepID=UPI003CFD6DD3